MSQNTPPHQNEPVDSNKVEEKIISSIKQSQLNLNQSLSQIELAAGAVPQTEVVATPNIRVAKNLLEQIEYFKLSYKLRFSHILWIGVGTFICYDRFNAYSQYRDEKGKIFGRNRKIIQDKYGKLNQKYTQSVINPRGDPDFGDWVYFKEMPDSDQKEFQQKRADFLDKSAQFNSFMPLYITSGVCFPFWTMMMGLLFKDKVFPLSLNTPTLSKTQQIENNMNDLQQNEEEIGYLSKLWRKVSPSNIQLTTIFGAATGFALMSSLRILKSFM